MPRANRYFLPGYVWHITHRCHKREFLLKCAQVRVKAIKEDKRILIEWGAYGTPTTVEWVSTSRPDNTTFVSVTNTGFSGDDDEVVKQALDSTEGFTLVLAGAKAFLEHNIILNLVADRFPDAIKKS